MAEVDPELVRLLRELQDCTDEGRRKQLRQALKRRSINATIEALNRSHREGTLKVRGTARSKQPR